LTEFYFPEEARQIRGVLADHAKSGRVVSASVEDSASISVLGLSYEDLGIGVAKSWGLPEGLQRCMRKPTGELPARAVDKPVERLRWLALAANDVTDILLRSDAGEAGAGLAAVAERYGRLLGVDAQQFVRAA